MSCSIKKPPLRHEKACIEPAITRDTRRRHRSPRISRSMSCRRLLELVRLSTRPVSLAHIVSPSPVMNADGDNADAHRAAKSRSLLALLQSQTGVLCGLRYHQSVLPRRAARGSETGSFSSTRTKFVFISVPRNSGYKFSGINEDAIFGPRIAAETCGKKDGVNSSACQDVTRRRSTRPE
jgi:hypothetical protein